MAVYRMATLFAFGFVLAANAGAHGVTISLHKTFSDSMVLQVHNCVALCSLRDAFAFCHDFGNSNRNA
jgi:hypothetical protein